MFNLKYMNKNSVKKVILTVPLSFLFSCTSYFTYSEDSLQNASQHIQSDIIKTNSLIEYSENSDFESIINDFLYEFYDIDRFNLSFVLYDTETNSAIRSYGNINEKQNVSNIFLPISTAILIEELNLNLDSVFPNILYTHENGNIVSSPLGNTSPDFFTGYITFREAFIKSNFPTFALFIENKDMTKFHEIIRKLGIPIDYDYRIPNLREVVGYGIFLTPKEIISLYEIFLNEGKFLVENEYLNLFSQDTISEILDLMYKSSFQTNKNLILSEETSYFLENETRTIYTLTGGYALSNEDFNIWLAGFYPKENPRYIFSINSSYNFRQPQSDYDIINYTSPHYVVELALNLLRYSIKVDTRY
ncbi:MAG: hypothetical protein FWE02_01280 [Defluviitaleaceae bacterium]|nr:hypothetical protein [Defluviitaleaceae bacterium]